MGVPQESQRRWCRRAIQGRLVAKGYNQVPGIDYDEMFAPVAKFTSIRAILSLAAELDLEIMQLDVKSAFLNGELDSDEVIYMDIPEGIEGHSDELCMLIKALYGLKQASRKWYEKLCKVVQELGVERIQSDFSIFVRIRAVPSSNMRELLIYLVYVDDTFVLSNSTVASQELKDHLGKHFEITELGELRYCLGIGMRRDRKHRTIHLSQSNFILQILEKYGMTNCKPVATPMDVSVKMTKSTDDDDDLADQTLYQQILGSLMYLAIATRPDIAAAISTLSQFASRPNQTHYQALKRLLRYLRGTSNYELTLGRQSQDNHERNDVRLPLELTGYSDASWGNDHDTRRSYSGYVFLLGDSPISWSSKRQSTVALSTTEAEYIALTQACKEAMWLRQLLSELSFDQSMTATTIYEDNQSTIALAKNPVYHARSKHIDIQHHYIREKVQSQEITLEYITTDDMIADIFTKPLPGPRHGDLAKRLSLKVMS